MCTEEREDAGVRKRAVQTDSLRRNQVTEEGGEEDKNQGIGNPGQVLQGDVPPQLPINPFIRCGVRVEKYDNQMGLNAKKERKLKV